MSSPAVSIGLFVFNAEDHLSRALDSLLGQTFDDYELIISDNASTDKTHEICENYASKDSRIRYIRQIDNIGPHKNFKYVLDQARGKYFMWAAADDYRSEDFLEENYNFLEKSPDYIAAASPNRMESRDDVETETVNFSLDGDEFSRIMGLFKHRWDSHGVFYALYRTNELRKCKYIGEVFFAADWVINLYMAMNGKIHRTERGYTIFGGSGESNRSGAYKAFRNTWIEAIIPFYILSKHVIAMTRALGLWQRLIIMTILLRINLAANYQKIFSTAYGFYNKKLKSI